MLPNEEELLKKLSIADLERANAYSKDLGMGLQIIRSFPQGVTIFGSARLPQDNKYCKMAYELGGLLAKNGHAVVTGGGPGIMEAASHGAYEIGGRTIISHRLYYFWVLLRTQSFTRHGVESFRILPGRFWHNGWNLRNFVFNARIKNAKNAGVFDW